MLPSLKLEHNVDIVMFRIVKSVSIEFTHHSEHKMTFVKTAQWMLPPFYI